MLNLKEILNSYPANLQIFKRGILREYIQYKILEIIYNSDYANKLVFMGGTALRIVNSNRRFSEDLDFDNKGLTQAEFTDLSVLIKNELELEGLNVEIKTVFKNAFRIYIRLPKILYSEGLSELQDEKLTIQVDTTPQNFNYSAKIFLLDKFDIYTEINSTPLDILLSEKFYAVFNRKRLKGRDFFDIDFLINNLGTKPNYEYLNFKCQIKNKKDLIIRLKEFLKDTNFKELADDVRAFLFNGKQLGRVENFYERIDILTL